MKALILAICLLCSLSIYAQPAQNQSADKTSNTLKRQVPNGFHRLEVLTMWNSPMSTTELGLAKLMVETIATADSSCVIGCSEPLKNTGQRLFMDVFNSTYKPSRAVKVSEYIRKHGKIDYRQSDSISFDVLVDQYSNMAKSPVTNTYLQRAIKNRAEKVTLLIGNDAKAAMNADTIAYTALNAEKPYPVFIDKDLINICYPFCTYIMAMKKGFLPIEIFIYMNDKSIKHKDEYIKAALSSIKFL